MDFIYSIEHAYWISWYLGLNDSMYNYSFQIIEKKGIKFHKNAKYYDISIMTEGFSKAIAAYGVRAPKSPRYMSEYYQWFKYVLALDACSY